MVVSDSEPHFKHIPFIQKNKMTMKNLTLEDMDAIIRVIYLRNKCVLDKIKRDAKALRKIKEQQRNDRIKKDTEYFNARDRITENKYHLIANKDLLIQIRKQGISIRKILNMFLKKWSQAEWNFIREVIFKDI